MTNQVVLPTQAQVEQFIRDLPWSPAASDHEKTLVAGNIRNFARWVGVTEPDTLAGVPEVRKDGDIYCEEGMWFTEGKPGFSTSMPDGLS